ncbi:MAG: lipoyl(octanoyl) transferase LipB [Pelagibacterales bacterium]|nr:lipoyl(octanoyl) transferase LipB [Pelagibacterales bacterium]
MLQKSNHNVEWLISKDLVHFEDALIFMQERVEKIIKNEAKSLIWILEHYPVYTAGISAQDSDLLNKTDIPIFKTNRGGKYTYHCPGMKIVYVMLDLKRFFAPKAPDVAEFVEFMENWVIDVLEEFGIKGEIRKGRVGIWVTDKNGVEKKIAAIGIKLKKWVSYHGIAINLSPDLSGFQNIVPCGIKEFGVTSIEEILKRKVDDEEFILLLTRKFSECKI